MTKRTKPKKSSTVPSSPADDDDEEHRIQQRASMVKVELLTGTEDGGETKSVYSSNASSRTGSSESLASNASNPGEDDLGDETLYERIAALKDIVSPKTRYTISSRARQTGRALKSIGRAAGNLVWIVTTSALLVGLPLALSLEDEAKIVAQEKEMLAQQQGQQQMLAGYPSAPGQQQQQKGLVPPGF